VSRSSEFCRRNPLCCFANLYCCLFRYVLALVTFGYTLVHYCSIVGIQWLAVLRLIYLEILLCVMSDQFHWFYKQTEAYSIILLDAAFPPSPHLHTI